jgi:hypothetical protein
MFLKFSEKSIFNIATELKAQKPELDSDLELRFYLRARASKLTNSQN